MSKMTARDPHRKKYTGGCEGGCCTTKRLQRISKKGVKQYENRELADLVLEATTPPDPYDERMTMEKYNNFEGEMRAWDEYREDGVYTTQSDEFGEALIRAMQEPLKDDDPFPGWGCVFVIRTAPDA